MQKIIKKNNSFFITENVYSHVIYLQLNRLKTVNILKEFKHLFHFYHIQSMTIGTIHMATQAIHFTSASTARISRASWTPAGALRCPAKRRQAHRAFQGIASLDFRNNSLLEMNKKLTFCNKQKNTFNLPCISGTSSLRQSEEDFPNELSKNTLAIRFQFWIASNLDTPCR